LRTTSSREPTEIRQHKPEREQPQPKIIFIFHSKNLVTHSAPSELLPGWCQELKNGKFSIIISQMNFASITKHKILMRKKVKTIVLLTLL
jgi:hypothetical protein